MKKTIIALLALTVMSQAAYEVFSSQTKKIGKPVKSEVVYFGDYTKFSSKIKKGVQDGTLVGAIGLASGVGAIYGVVALLDPFIMSFHYDQKVLKITKITDRKGRVAFKKSLLVSSSKLPMPTIQKILKNK